MTKPYEKITCLHKIGYLHLLFSKCVSKKITREELMKSLIVVMACSPRHENIVILIGRFSNKRQT